MTIIDPTPDHVVTLAQAGMLTPWTAEKIFLSAHIRHTLNEPDGRITVPRLVQLMQMGIIDLEEYNSYAPLATLSLL